MSWNQRYNTKERFRGERSRLKELLLVVKSVLFHYKDLSVFQKQVQEGREKGEIPGKEGCQALTEVRTTHFKLIRKTLYILKWLVYRRYAVIADNLMSLCSVAGQVRLWKELSFWLKLRSLASSVIACKWPWASGLTPMSLSFLVSKVWCLLSQ